MSAKAKAVTTLALLLATIGGCTREVKLPALYPAPCFTLTNQDGLEVKLSDFRGKVVVMNFVYTRYPDVCGELEYKIQGVYTSNWRRWVHIS